MALIIGVLSVSVSVSSLRSCFRTLLGVIPTGAQKKPSDETGSIGAIAGGDCSGGAGAGARGCWNEPVSRRRPKPMLVARRVARNIVRRKAWYQHVRARGPSKAKATETYPGLVGYNANKLVEDLSYLADRDIGGCNAVRVLLHAYFPLGAHCFHIRCASCLGRASILGELLCTLPDLLLQCRYSLISLVR